jgi:hypothetical protein
LATEIEATRFDDAAGEQRREPKEPAVLFAFERTGQRPERRREQPLLARLARTIFAAPILVAPLRHADA